MSYEPTVWKDGDLVTSAKLNKLEQGIANGGGMMVVHQNPETGALDKTWQEISNGGFGVITGTNPFGTYYFPIVGIYNDTNQFMIIVMTNGDEGPETEMLIAQSADDYPTWQNINNNDDESSGGVVK